MDMADARRIVLEQIEKHQIIAECAEATGESIIARDHKNIAQAVTRSRRLKRRGASCSTAATH